MRNLPVAFLSILLVAAAITACTIAERMPGDWDGGPDGSVNPDGSATPDGSLTPDGSVAPDTGPGPWVPDASPPPDSGFCSESECHARCARLATADTCWVNAWCARDTCMCDVRPCDGPDADIDVDSDVDTDVDIDSDVDTDVDIDADADTDVDVDSDIDADGGPSFTCAFGESLADQFDRSCRRDYDCTFSELAADCCGTTIWTGVSSDAQVWLNLAWAECSRELPVCDCPAGPAIADDGTTEAARPYPHVSCEAGLCQTTFL